VTLFLDTLRALAQPRRALPIALVATPLVVAQWWFSRGHTGATWLGLGMVTLFVLVGPWSWRALFPPGTTPATRPLWLLGYAALGAIPAVLGDLAPTFMGLPETFLTRGINTAVVVAMFWVGGWGLGRDIDQEQGLARQTARAERLQAQVQRAELMAMRAHLDPHFLFNTLNAIAAWVHEDADVAEQAILDLARILREVLGGIGEGTWPLHRELALARDVWALHQLRDPSWFEVDWQVDPGLDEVPVPPMLLLPLIENAITHGPAKGHRGTVSLHARAEGDQVVLTIANPGPLGAPRPGGHGLDMVRRRMQLGYGDTAGPTLTSTDGRVTATVRLARRGPAEDGP